MPLTYAPDKQFTATVTQFLAHWQLIESFTAQVFVLAGNITRQDLQMLLLEVEKQQLALVDARLAKKIARSDALKRSSGMRLRLNQFNERVRAMLPESLYAKMLPRVPLIYASEGKLLPPFRVAAELWELIEASGTPFVLLGSYTRVTYLADLALLTQIYATYAQVKQLEQLLLASRNQLQQRVRKLLVLYRRTVLSGFVKTSPVVKSLPRYSPSRKKE